MMFDKYFLTCIAFTLAQLITSPAVSAEQEPGITDESVTQTEITAEQDPRVEPTTDELGISASSLHKRLRFRWEEDWSIFRDVASINDDGSLTPAGVLGAIKHIPLGESDETYLSLGGEYRFAYEMYNKANSGVDAAGRQDAVQHRYALHADLHLNRDWRVFSQLGYATENGREGGPKAIDETEIDLWQLFVDRRIKISDSERIVLRVGRQLIETANVFITAGEANNIRLYYDGIRTALLVNNKAKYEAFAAEYVSYDSGSFDMTGTGEYFWGGRGGYLFEESDINLDFTYLGWDLLDRQFEQSQGQRFSEKRHTALLWMTRPITTTHQLGLDYYLAYQFGDYDDQVGGSDISAYAAFGEMKYALYPQAETPLFGLKTSYFSGDKDSEDGELNTFYNPVFGTPYFGYARDIMPFNLIHLQPNIGYRFNEKIVLTLSHEFLWRAQKEDAYYNSPNSILVGAGETDARDIGQQTQLALRYTPTKDLILSVFVSRLFAGDVITDAGGEDRDYFHFGVNYLL